MNIIWGYKADPHITAQQLRNTYAGIFGGDTHILDTGSKLAATVVSATEVQIADGVMIAQGCTASIEHGETESLTIANGSQGMFRKDLIVARYTKTAGTGVENMALAVITGTPASASPAIPSHSTGVIADGDSPIDFPLYVVNLDGISITSVDALVDTISISGLLEEFADRLDTAEGNIPTVVTEDFVESGISIGANGAKSYTKAIAKAGYTPVAIGGIWIENGQGGRNGGWTIAQNWFLNKITVDGQQVDEALFTLWNQHTSQSAVVQLSFKVTYVSNNAVRG